MRLPNQKLRLPQGALKDLDDAARMQRSIARAYTLEKRGDARRMLGDYQVSCSAAGLWLIKGTSPWVEPSLQARLGLSRSRVPC